MKICLNLAEEYKTLFIVDEAPINNGSFLDHNSPYLITNLQRCSISDESLECIILVFFKVGTNKILTEVLN